VQGLGYITSILYICVKINTLNDKERPICLLAALQTVRQAVPFAQLQCSG
jgi:hypothetical protein